MQPRPSESRGVRVGPYLVTGRIGRGGMGTVYRALDEKLQREVALKTLSAEGGLDTESRKRFEREALAAAKLVHPNIVTIYLAGEDRGVPYIAMEMLPGADLEAILRGGEPLTLAEKLDVVVQVCRGLAFAHEHGIVHRDVKPSNIRLLDDGGVKIMDFGIAKGVGGTHLTKTGMMVGTVHYMSPEQVRGKPLDGRSDVFSTGVILYEMLAGQRPFRGEGATQVLYKIVNEEPPPLDLAAIGEHGPRLSAVVARALAKDPEQRYPTAAALATDLAALLDELKRAAGPPVAGAVTALSDARRLAKEGRTAEAVTTLRTIVAEHSAYVEARRALRLALREEARRAQPAPVAADGYPELEATFQATATRRATSTELAPTVVVPTSGTSAEQPAAITAPAARGVWLWVGIGLAVVASLAGFVLLRGSRHAPAPLRLPVRSQPMGASVLIDGRDSGVLTNGEVTIPPPLSSQVVLTFRKAGHRDETRTVTLPPSDPAGVSVTLEASAPQLTVKTEPAGASVTVDGQRQAGVTPLQLTLDPTTGHTVVASLDGYVSQEKQIPKGESPATLELTLPKLAPPGAVVVSSSYPLDVLWRGRQLAKASVSPRVSLAGGRQTLTLNAPSVFLHAELPVNVVSGGEVTLDAPALGKLNVRANPDNCKIFVDGAFVDYPPILDRAAAIGRHTVRFQWPDGQNEQTIEVQRGSPAFVFGRKE